METIRIRVDVTYQIPKGEFKMGSFDIDRMAEELIRSHFPDPWWDDPKHVIDLGPCNVKIDNLSLTPKKYRRR